MEQKHLVKSVVFAVFVIGIVGLFVYVAQLNTEKRSKAAFTQEKACSAQCSKYSETPKMYTACMTLCGKSQGTSPSPAKSPISFPTLKPTGTCISKCIPYTGLQKTSCLSKCNTIGLPPPR